jgi:aldehyde dehydrogenase (NAD+)
MDRPSCNNDSRYRCGDGLRAEAEVAASVDRLFSYAAWADKFDGTTKSVPIRGVALAMREPVGVIGLLAPDDAPLLGAVSLMAPAIAMGNRVVLVPSWPAPLAATDLYQVLDTSDVPGGVVNIVTGDPAELGSGRSPPISTWMRSGPSRRAPTRRRWKRPLPATSNARGSTTAAIPTGCRPRAAGGAFSTPRTEVKTIWVPYGE